MTTAETTLIDPATETSAMEHAPSGHHDGHAAVPFYMDATFWVAVSIVVFIAAIFKTIKKMYVQTTDKYATGVSRQLAEAKELKSQAETMIKEYREKQKQGAAECERIIQQAKTDAESMREASLRELKATIKIREQQAVDKIGRLESEIMKELRLKTADMAIDATQKILSEILDAHRNATLVDQAIREMPKQLN